MSRHDDMQITVSENGPYLVAGSIPLSKFTIGTNQQGDSAEWLPGAELPTTATYALCRCGQSRRKPFCDGSHAKSGFDGRETASRKPYLQQATLTEGTALSLTDAEPLCAFARFCDPNGQVWNQVHHTDDPATAEQFVRQVNDCPGGRLRAWQRGDNEPLEAPLSPSLGLIEDPQQQVSGPLWVRGMIRIIGADGHVYEVRNRVTLCRCGASRNKPFCDGSHAADEVKFRDGL